jgi:hypothetical protein
MYARIVTFCLDGLTAAEYQDHVAAVAPAFTTWPGLLAKVWSADDESGTYGGIYLFADRDSADCTRDTDLFRTMATNPVFADVWSGSSTSSTNSRRSPAPCSLPDLQVDRTRPSRKEPS